MSVDRSFGIRASHQHHHEIPPPHSAASDSVVVLPKDYHALLKLTPFPQYRTSRTGARSTRTQIDHDVFEGLPVRHWRKRPISISTAPEKETIIDLKTRNLAWPELEMPRDSNLLSEMSQNLLRAARMPQAKRVVPAPLVEDDKDQGEDEEGDGEIDTAFIAKRWAVLPKDLEGPEPEYLAKRRKGLPSIHSSGTDALNGTPRMRKTKIRKYDASGNSSVLEVLIPDGQTVDGELFEEETSPIQVPAPGTVVDGVGVVNAEGLVVAGDQAAPVVNRRRPPPPKRRPKGPGRGRRKRVAFAGPDGMPTSNAPDGLLNGASHTEEGSHGENGVVNGSDTIMAEEGSEEGSEGEENEDGEDGEREEGELSSSHSSSHPPSKSSSPMAIDLQSGKECLEDSVLIPPPEVQVIPPPIENISMDNVAEPAGEPVVEVVDQTAAGVFDQDAETVDETSNDQIPSTSNELVPTYKESHAVGIDSQSPLETALDAKTEPETETAEDHMQGLPDIDHDPPAESYGSRNETTQAPASDEIMEDFSDQDVEEKALGVPLEEETGPGFDAPSELKSEYPLESVHEPMSEPVPDSIGPEPEPESTPEQINTSQPEETVVAVQEAHVDSSIGILNEDGTQDNTHLTPPSPQPSQEDTPDQAPQTSEQIPGEAMDEDVQDADRTSSVQVDPEQVSELNIELQPEPDDEADPILDPGLMSPSSNQPIEESETKHIIDLPRETIPKVVTNQAIEPIHEPTEAPVERKFSFTRPTSSPKAPTPSPPTPIEDKFALRPPYYSPKAPTMSPPTPIDRSMPGSPDELLDQDFQLLPQMDGVQEGDPAFGLKVQQIPQADRISVEAAPQVEPQMNAQIPVDHDPLNGMTAPKLGHETHANDQSSQFSDGEEDLLGGLERSLNQQG